MTSSVAIQELQALLHTTAPLLDDEIKKIDPLQLSLATNILAWVQKQFEAGILKKIYPFLASSLQKDQHGICFWSSCSLAGRYISLFCCLLGEITFVVESRWTTYKFTVFSPSRLIQLLKDYNICDEYLPQIWKHLESDERTKKWIKLVQSQRQLPHIISTTQEKVD